MKKIYRAARTVALGAGALMMTASWPISANADVNDSMNAYWSSSLGSANVTGPTAYQGQSAGYYTMGNVAFRGPQQTTQIASVQMPSVRAGCGGIDIFSGGFSFINSDQLVAQMKAVASNAVSYAFMLALKTLSPIVADQIEQLQGVADKVNQFNMSSCQQAQALVGGLWGRSDTASGQICQDLAAYKGFYSDRIASRHGCMNNRTQQIAGIPEAQAIVPQNTNIAWEAVRKHPLLAGDRELSELFMTLTGTIIYRCPNDAGCIVDVLPADGANDGVITKLLDGGTLRVHRCDEVGKCLNPVKYGGSQTVGASSALGKRVEAMLRSITTKIQARQPLTVEEKDFLNMVSLPVYKMASVIVAHERSLSANTLAQYADVIALDLTLTWIDRSVMEMENGARNLNNIDEEQLKQWRDSIDNLRAQLTARQALLAERTNSIESMIARFQAVERILAARVGSRIADSVTFSSSLVPNGAG